jgi:hypothetical protein
MNDTENNLQTELDTAQAQVVELKEKLMQADAKVVSLTSLVRGVLSCVEALPTGTPLERIAKINKEMLAKILPALEEAAQDMPKRPRLILDLLRACVMDAESGEYIPHLLAEIAQGYGSSKEIARRVAGEMDALIKEIQCL